jgi:hypothetical protein
VVNLFYTYVGIIGSIFGARGHSHVIVHVGSRGGHKISLDFFFRSQSFLILVHVVTFYGAACCVDDDHRLIILYSISEDYVFLVCPSKIRRIGYRIHW